VKKFYILFLIFTVNFNVFALSADCTAVPWTTGLRLRDSASTRGKDNAGIEVDSTKSTRTTHQINREGHQIGRYFGDYISLGTNNSRKIELYNPSEKKTITGFHSNDFYIVMAVFYKEGSPGSYIIRKVDYNNNILDGRQNIQRI